MNLQELGRAVVLPVVRRHAEDAAFYWRQLDAGVHEVGLSARRSQHFAQTLSAHLEGLSASGPKGVEVAADALNRWRKPGEVFVAAWAALQAEDSASLNAVLHLICHQPDALLRGVISALAYAPDPLALTWVNLHARFDAANAESALQRPVATVAALRTCALKGWPVSPEWLGHGQPIVRAAACRGVRQQALLQPLLKDADIAVRAEAAIALGQCLPPTEGSLSLIAAGTLWSCVAAQVDQRAQATGWNRMQAERRLCRWVRELAWLAPVGHPDIATLLQNLPPRAALDFVLYHGDLRQLPFAVQAMRNAEVARWAGWVWQCLTGRDLRRNSLILPEPTIDPGAPLTRERQDADQGLPLPDPRAIETQPVDVQQGERQLMGRPLNAQHMAQLLCIDTDAPQALRAVAARAWNALRPDTPVNLRSRTLDLLDQDQRLAGWLDSGARAK